MSMAFALRCATWHRKSTGDSASPFSNSPLAGHMPHITFFGHTHLPCFFALNSRGDLISEFIDETTPQSRATIRLDESTHYLINPGSVGQPRDRDPRAGYALFDPDKRTVELTSWRKPVKLSCTVSSLYSGGSG